MSDPSTVRSAAHAATVARLACEFEVTQSARPVFLLGAGASYRSGVPLAAEATHRIGREAFARQRLGTHAIAGVKPSDYQPFLAEQPWFIKGAAAFAQNFPLAVKHLLTPASYRREFFARELRAHNGLSEGYIALARLAQRGLWRVLLTTNFDACTVEALARLAPHVRRPLEIDLQQAQASAFNVYGLDPQIVYLHGRVETYTDRNTPDEVASFPPWLAQLLMPVLRSSPVVVVGYRGSEPSIMEGLFGALRSDTANFRAGIYWCRMPMEELHPHARALQEAIGSNFFELVIDGFDELLTDLNARLASQDMAARPDLHTKLRHASLGPDETVLPQVSMSDLDEDVLLATLVTYCARVERPIVTRQSVPGLLVEQGLAQYVDGQLRPTVGAFLLFGKNTSERYPHAYVELTFGGKRRQIIRGNLIAQYNELLRILTSSDVNHEIRLKSETSSRKVQAYHRRSLTEMLVNLLVHRDYETNEISRIDVRDGEGIRFVNPGGLNPAIAGELLPGGDGPFEPKRMLTFLRNKALADVFYGLGPMDKKGSGLCDALDLMREHGGEARFEVANENSRFIADLLQARQANPGTSDTAISRHPYGIYTTNHLRVAVLPQSVSVIPIPSGTRVRQLASTDLFARPDASRGLYIEQRDRVVSFCKPERLSDLVAAVQSSMVDVEFFRGRPGGSPTLARLLRVHFVEYLRRFESDGLYVDAGGHRAYFIKNRPETPRIRYNTPRRQGIEREMVKRREMREEVFHENEGVDFDVVWFDGAWAFELKPFYMFTGPDGVEPLPRYRQGRLATSRMRFDRNPAVRSDLTFWARYLSQGAPVIPLVDHPDYSLVLEGAFHEIEVLEPDSEGSTAASQTPPSAAEGAA